MRRSLRASRTAAVLILTVAPMVSAVENMPKERNYQVIVDRNPFGLKPPPPPMTNPPPVMDKPKDEILLTGITSIGPARAYFMSNAPQGKNPEYYSLGVKDKQDGLEVVDIDLANKSVKVRNGGIETVMTFASNGVKPPVAPVAAPGTPGAPGAVQPSVVPPVPGMVAPPGGGVPSPSMGASATTPAAGRMRTIPSRNLRTARQNIATPVPDQSNVAPDPDAGVRDTLMLELQKRSNPHIEFPPTPMPLPE